MSVLKNEHKKEVAKQYLHDKNWIEPYYIERYYSVIEEYHSEKVGYDIQIITMHMDAFYANSDNLNIPIMDALKVVSLIQDGMREKQISGYCNYKENINFNFYFFFESNTINHI